MKISLGFKIRSGPWGGGNQFCRTLCTFLRERGWEVQFDLNDPGLDIVLLADPREKSSSASFNHRDVAEYLKKANPDAIVVHRINECDERKGTEGINEQILKGNLCADHTVFISSWLRDLYRRQGFDRQRVSVIRNGADGAIFFPSKTPGRIRGQKLRIVTHHWSANRLKGFDIYQRLDDLFARPDFRSRFIFTYIGNLPEGFRFRNSEMVPSMEPARLGEELRKHHLYLTASLNEPAGMHHIEGALCGLPLLYRESGALPEYGEGFGLAFHPGNFEEKLNEMVETYDHWKSRMPQYSYSADWMCRNYLELFEDLLSQKETILSKRKKPEKFHGSYRIFKSSPA